MTNIPILGAKDLSITDFLRTAPAVPNPRLNSLAVSEEQFFMHLVLKEKELLERAMDAGITYACFHSKDLGKLYAIAAKYFTEYKGATLSRPSLDSILARTMTPEEAANFRTKYDDCAGQFGVKASDFPMYLDNMEARYVQRQAYAICQKFGIELMESTTDQKKLVMRFQEFASEISMLGEAKNFMQTVTLNELYEKTIAPELIQRRDHPEDFLGIRCLYPQIDADYNGFQRGRYMVITATEGGGKSTFMLNLGFNFAYAGNTVVYVTIESSNKDIGYKVLSMGSDVHHCHIMKGGDIPDGLNSANMSKLHSGIKSISTSGIGDRFYLIQALENTPRDTICRAIQRIKAFRPVDVVIIDYLQVVGREVSYGERVDQAIADVSNKLRAWGRLNNVLLITANQIKADKGRRLQEDVKDESEVRITKGDTSGTKEISGAADYMFGVWIPLSRDRMVVFSTKNRHGRDSQQYTLSFDQFTGRVAEMNEWGNADRVAGTVGSREERERIRKGFDSNDEATMDDIPGKRTGEEPPAGVQNPKPSWAQYCGNEEDPLTP